MNYRADTLQPAVGEGALWVIDDENTYDKRSV